jgi:hypothetical protein
MVRRIPAWWPTSQAGAAYFYANGLIFWRGKLWVAPRSFYAVDPAASLPLTLYAEDGQTITVPGLTAQKFSGFIKRGPGLDPLLGAGGYESGQGSQSGPSLATLSGQKLIEYQWPGAPGAPDANGVPTNWNQRAPRDTNYRPIDGATMVNGVLTGGFVVDWWGAWIPRVINGALQGRWASDMVFGGGLDLPEGITFWPWIGTGDLAYARQTALFAGDGLQRTYRYRYDRTTYQFVDYTAIPEFVYMPVTGHELGPDGKVYLATAYQYWDPTDPNRLDIAVRVYSAGSGF